MRARRAISILRSVLLGCATGALAPAWAGSLTPGLEDVLATAAPDDRIPVVVMMEAFPDRETLLGDVRGMSRRERRAHVVATLGNLARQSQRGVRAAVASETAEIGRVRVLWGINGLALEATPRVIELLAALPGVRRVLHDHAEGHLEIDPSDPVWRVSEPPLLPAAERGAGDGHTDGLGPTGGDTSGPNPDATVRGEVTAMGAEQVWNDLGYTGAGVIVAVIDTGIDRDHPDLADHIWTNLDEIANNGVDDDGNGYIDDTWGWDLCLDNNDPSAGSHGTQVAGQVAGDGTNGTVTGMAPDAELMALGIDCDTPSIGWAASDYAIANGAHVITQSYSWWWTDQPDYEAFRRQTDTELAAGILHVNSAGNGGTNPSRPIPYNISTPANCPAPWIHPDQTLVGGVSSIIAAGNISWSTDLIDPSSSLGPSAWEDIQANTDPAYPHVLPPEFLDYPYQNGAQMGLIKPDLSAYGSGTSTTCPGTGYCGFSGTSSAAPHVSGTVALMLQSNPEATPAELAEALMTTAEHRGDPGKNNVYGTGLVQAFAAVEMVESGLFYDAHVVDDTNFGNADLELDPGEQVVMSVTVRSVEETSVSGLQAILSTTTPGVTIHDHVASFPAVPAEGSATSVAPHFSLSVDPAACATVVVFDLELRFDGKTRHQPFVVRVGTVEPLTLLADDFESDLGWTSDPGTTTRGAWVREDPIGVVDGVGQPSNPEDDTTPDPGVTCWVTGNGELTGRKDENNNDVDDGATTLLSPPFGVPNLLALDLSYDRWYYDNSGGGDFFKAEISNDGGQGWLTVEHLINSSGGWGTQTADLFALLPPSDDMRLRFVVQDGSDDTAVEGAVDEVVVDGIWVNCQDYTPPPAQAPNPVGQTLAVGVDLSGHVVLTWQAPPVDAGHDAATLYRIGRATSPAGPFSEVGSATSTQWIDVDALSSSEPFYYRVRAENAGGAE